LAVRASPSGSGDGALFGGFDLAAAQQQGSQDQPREADDATTQANARLAIGSLAAVSTIRGVLTRLRVFLELLTG
jgi:hypothetical protein